MLVLVFSYLAAENPQLVILEDYNKGVLTEKVIQTIVSLCRKHDIITAVDPKRKNFFAYSGVTLFKPNLKEIKEGLNIFPDQIALPVLREMHDQLKERLHHRFSLITLSENGVFYEDGLQSDIIPTHIRNIADVSGAGDTVIAVASVIYAVSKDVRLSAVVANIAGGLVCEEVGTASVDRDKLKSECKRLLV